MLPLQAIKQLILFQQGLQALSACSLIKTVKHAFAPHVTAVNCQKRQLREMLVIFLVLRQ